MLNSRDIDRLRPDVAANCRVFIAACEDQGLNVLVHQTVRDEAYQLFCVSMGWAPAAATVPTFHHYEVGLAFDFCRNIRGQEFTDRNFFFRCAEIAEQMGFVWGGRWTSQDLPHLQWGGPDKNWTSAQIKRRELPPLMPLFERGLTVGQYEELKAELAEIRGTLDLIAARVLPRYEKIEDVPEFGRKAVQDAIDRKIMVGVTPTNLGLSWGEVRSMVLDHNRENAKPGVT